MILKKPQMRTSMKKFDTLPLSIDQEEPSTDFIEDIFTGDINMSEIQDVTNLQNNNKGDKKTKSRPPKKHSLKRDSTSGCFIKGIILMLFGFIVLILLALVFSVYKYFSIAADITRY